MSARARREEFDRRGVIRIEGLIPAAAAASARAVVSAVLEDAGVARDGEWLDRGPVDGDTHRALNKRLKRCADSPAFKALDTEEVREVATELLDGRPYAAMLDRPQLLFTPPNSAQWRVPHAVWHCDVPRLGELGRPGVQMFTFLDAVAPRGGGTLVVAGSHRLLNDRGRIRSKDCKRELRREKYFRDLMTDGPDRQRFVDEPGHVGDVTLQVVELCGQPGDVFITDLRVLHNLAPNALRRPRLMVTQRYLLAEAVGDVIGASPDRVIR